MSTPRKAKKSILKDVGSLPVPVTPLKPKPVEPVVVSLGERTFTIQPISNRKTAEAYDDAAEFTIVAMPLLRRLLTMASTNSVDVGLGDATSPQEIVAEMVASISEQDVIGLVREMRDVLPTLACIACKTDDPDISVDAIKILAGSPLNDELFGLVFAQIQAESLLEKVLSLGAGFALPTPRG